MSLEIAQSGMNSARLSQLMSTRRVAQASTSSVQSSDAPNVNLVDETMTQLQSKRMFQANANTVKVQDQMLGMLMDTTA